MRRLRTWWRRRGMIEVRDAGVLEFGGPVWLGPDDRLRLTLESVNDVQGQEMTARLDVMLTWDGKRITVRYPA